MAVEFGYSSQTKWIRRHRGMRSCSHVFSLMRYKVAYVKLKNISHDEPQFQPSNWKIQIRTSNPKVQQPQNMILVESPDSNFVERKNAINKMVNTETPEDLRENEQKDTFQYQVPRVRASFTLKVAPDSTTADLPEPTPTNELSNSSDQTESLADNKINDVKISPSTEANLPQYGPHLPGYDPVNLQFDQQLPDFSPHIPAQAPIINNVPRVPKPVLANRSSHYMYNDDKDFEIPLEESLKAVEDFIKREKELARWHVGEDVLAKWKGNGLFYKAEILEILPSGVVVVLYDTYDITEEVDHRDLCKFFKKTCNFKKKGQPQDKSTVDIKNKAKMGAKKQMKLKKRRKKLCKRFHFVSVFKRSDRLRKKRLYACRKQYHNLPIARSRNKAPMSPNTKNEMVF